VLVTGAGPIGLLCAAVAAASGATEIVVTDINEGRLRHATKFGATSSILDGTADLAELSVQPNVLIECSGAESATRAGIGALSPRGRAVLVGMGANADLSLPVATIQTHELEVTGTFRYANAYPAAIALITKGVFDPTALVGAVFNLDEVEQALNASRLDPTILKAVVGIS
jgi:L-iditol 2-dehydrogenase